MIRLATLFIYSLPLLACDKTEEARTPREGLDTIRIPDTEVSDASLKAARVVAYRFALPGDGTPGAVMESGFSLLTKDGVINLALLNRLKVTEADLTGEHVTRLVDAVYGDHEKTGAAACYDPHHIFLFYDSADMLFRVIEQCFSCTNLRAQPEIAELQWWRHDFRELARICDEAGIGMASGTAEDQIRFWDERDQL